MGLFLIIVFVLQGTFQQVLVQLAFSSYRVVVCARAGYTSAFASHHFDELCIHFSGLGVSTEYTDILLREVRELHNFDAVGFRAR